MAKYSTEFKKKIVAEYLKGNIGYGSLAKKYNIPSMNPIATWVAAFQSLGTKGISRSLFSPLIELESCLRIS